MSCYELLVQPIPLQTTSAARSVAPIVNQVSHLLLSIENNSNEVKRSPNLTNSFVEKQTGRLSLLVHELIENVSRAKPASLKESSPGITEAGCNRLDLACRNVQLCGRSFAESSDSQSHSSNFTGHLKELLDSMFKLFMAVEQVEVDRLLGIVSWVKDILRTISLSTSLPHLVQTFKQYTEGLLVLFNFIAKIQRDLKNDKKKRSLGSAALVLKKIAPSINKCCQICIKYPDNSQAMEDKTQVFGQLMDTLNEIGEIVRDNSITSDGEESKEGLFVVTIDQVLAYLKDKPTQLDDGEFELLISRVVNHSASVISLSGDSSNTSSAITSCILVLETLTHLIPLCKNCRHNSSLLQLREDFNVKCEALITDMHDLERNVNCLLIEHIVDVFKETTGPLDRLVRFVLSKPQMKESVLMERAGPFIDEFCDHSGRMYQVARLVMRSSSNTDSIQRVNAALSRLERLDGSIVPSLIKQQADVLGDVNAFTDLYQKWTNELRMLCSAIDEISDSSMFVEMTGAFISKYAKRLGSLLKTATVDVHELAYLVRAQTGLSNHLLTVLSHHRHGNTTGNDRDMEQATSNLKKVITNLTQTAGLLTTDVGESSYRKSLSEQSCLLEKCVQIIKDILNGEAVNLQEINVLGDTQTISDPEESVDIERISDGAQMWLSLEPNSKLYESSLPERHSFLPSPLEGELDVSLSALIEDMFKYALTGDVTNSELCCTQLLSAANDIVSVANSLLPYVEDMDDKQVMRDLVSTLCKQTAQFPAKVRQLPLSDGGVQDELRSLLESWAKNIESLWCYCDRQLVGYLSVATPLIAASQANNSILIESARQEFEEVNKRMNSILSCDDNSKSTESMMVERFRLTNNRLHNKIHRGLEDPCDAHKVKSLCRQWACNLLSTERTMQRSLQHSLLLNCSMSSVEFSDCLSLMEHTIKYIWNVLRPRATENHRLTCKKLVEGMSSLLDTIAVFITPDDWFTKLQGVISTCFFATKACEFFKIVDALIEPHCTHLNNLVHLAIRVYQGNEGAKQALTASYEREKGKLRNAARSLSSSQLVVQISDRLETLIAISDRLLTEAVSDAMLSKYKAEMRLLVVHLLELKQTNKSSSSAEEEKLIGQLVSSDISTDKGRQSLDNLLTPEASQRPDLGQLLSKSAELVDLHSHEESIKKSKITETPFSRAVRQFRGDLARWADRKNTVVKAAQELANNLQSMSQYVKYQEGPIRSRKQLFDMAQQVVSFSGTITQFCQVVGKYSLASWRFGEELMYHSNQVAFYAEQLCMLTSVKRATSPFDLTIKALATNGDNLLTSILKSFKACESILLKGLREPPATDTVEQDIYKLAVRWRSQLERHRHAEITYSDVNDLGLRVVSKVDCGPQLSEICQPK